LIPTSASDTVRDIGLLRVSARIIACLAFIPD
jgi:hypothetical protein